VPVGDDNQSLQYPCSQSAGRRRLGVPHPAKVSRQRQLHLANQSKMIHDISGKAQVRLCKRYRQRITRGKPATVVTMAIAQPVPGTSRPESTRQQCTQKVNPRAWTEAQPRCDITLGSVKSPGGHTQVESEAGP
jgi:hypothetical protein